MSNIVIKTVSNNKELKEFIRFHTELYKDSPTDIPISKWVRLTR